MKCFDVIRVEGNTAFLRRTNAPTFSPEGDGWWRQRFNTSRVAKCLKIKSPKIPEFESLESQVATLEARLAEKGAV